MKASEPGGKWVIAAAVLGSGIAFLDSTVVNVALPDIGAALGGGLSGLQWIMNGYLLPLASFVLIGGSLGDLFGRRRIFTLGLAGFAGTSLLCALAPSIQALIAARALQGLAAALLIPGSLAIIAASFDEAERGRAIGMWSGLASVTTAFGPFLGGYLVDVASWRWIFVINLPFAILALWVTRRHVPESRDPSPRHPDAIGGLIAAAGFGGLTYALIEASARGLGDARVIVAAAVGLAGLTAFIPIERARRDPMLPLSLFSSRQFSGANLTTFAVYAALSGTFFLVVLHVRTRLGYSGTEAGLVLIPVTVLLLLLSPSAGRLADRIGPRLPMTLGPLGAAAGMLLYSRVAPGDTFATTVLPATIVFGLGLALTVAPLTTAVLSAVDQRHTGIVSAVNNAIARVAGLLAVAVLPIAVGASGASQASLTVPQFRAAMTIAAGLCAAGGAIAFATVRGRSGERAATQQQPQPQEG